MVDQQARESEIAEKETVPPLALDNKTPTSISECRPDSFAYRSPQIVSTTPRSNASPASPLLHPSLSQAPIATSAELYSQMPSLSVSSYISPIPGSRAIFSVNPPSGGDVTAAPFDEVALERNEEEARGLTLDFVVPQDTLGFPATPDEENQIAKATLSLPRLARSLLSSPQCSSNANRKVPNSNALSPLRGTRLVRSKAVSNFLALRSRLQDKAATADADFFDTPSVKAGVFNTLLLPTLAVNFDYADLASPSRAAGTGLRECSNQPSVVAEPHPC